MRACVRACVCVCVCVCVDEGVHAYTCMRMCVHACSNTLLLHDNRVSFQSILSEDGVTILNKELLIPRWYIVINVIIYLFI